jgi:nitrogen fixation/metabolism regulation signal transduction histidine kinase
MARVAYVNGQYLPHRSAAVNIENRGYRDPVGSGAPGPLYRSVHRAVFLQRTAHPEIVFEPVFPANPVPVSCDARLVGQALINIVKNAIESIEARRQRIARARQDMSGCRLRRRMVRPP